MSTEKQMQPWASSTDVRLADPETSIRSGSRGGRDPPSSSRGNTVHNQTGPPCCPSCGVALPPSILGGQLARSSSLSSMISSMFSPGSSMRGGSLRAGSLLNFVQNTTSGAPGHKYEAVGDEGGAGTDVNDIDERCSVHPSLTCIEDDDLPPGADSTSFDVESARPAGSGSGSRVVPGVAPPPTDKAAPPPGGWLTQYLRKARGIPGKRPPPRHTVAEGIWSFIGALIGITALAALDQYVAPELDTLLLTASFGAAAVLVYSAPTSPLAQPVNLAVGTMLSSLIGVIVRIMFQGHVTFLAAGTAVAAAIFVMGVTGTTHPPGGAISLIAVIGGKRVVDMGFWYVLFPGTVGPLLLLLVAVVVNNLNPQRSYPVWWY